MAFEYKRNRNKVTSETTSPKFTYTRDLEKRKAYQAQKSALEEQKKPKLNSLAESVIKTVTTREGYKPLESANKAILDVYAKQADLMNMDIDSSKAKADEYEAALPKLRKYQGDRANILTTIRQVESDLQYKKDAGWDVTHDEGSLKDLQAQLATIDAETKKYASQYGFEGLEDMETGLSNLRKDIRTAYTVQTNKKLTEKAMNSPEFETKNAYGKTTEEGVEKVKAFLYLFPELTLNNVITDPKHEMYGGGTVLDPGHDFYEAMSEDEKKVLGYYLENGETGEAREYLESIQESVGAKVAAMYSKESDNWFDELMFSVASGADQFASGLKGVGNAIAGKEGYVYSTPVQQGSALIRKNISEREGIGNRILGGAYDLTQTTANMLPSVLVGMVNPTAGAVVMGASAGGNAYNEMINLGYSANQARAYGLMVGASETLLERFLGGVTALRGTSVAEKLASKIDNAFGRAAITIGADALSEFTEETLQTYLEPWFKSIVTDLDYEAPGIDEALYAGLLGALSAGMFNGGTLATNAAVNKIHQVQAETNFGETLLKTENANASIKNLIDNAQNSGNKKLERTANKVAKTEKDGAYDVSARKVGKLTRLSFEQLAKSIEDTATGKDLKSQTVEKLTKSGMNQKGAERAFDLIARDASRGSKSKELLSLIDKNPDIRTMYDNMVEYLSEEAVTKRVEDVAKASPVTEISNRIVDQRLKDAGIEVVDESGDIDNIDSVVNVDEFGNFVLKRKSGETVTYDPSSYNLPNVDASNADKVSFATELFGLNGAQTYVKLAPDNASVEYKSAFHDIYNQGNTNKAFTQIDADISLEAQKAIYEAGKADFEAAKQRKIDAEKKAEAAEKAAKEKEASFVKKEMGFKSDRVTVSDAALEKLKAAKKDGKGDQYKAAVKVIDGLAKMLQVNINIVASETDSLGRYVGANGQYNRATNTFTLDIASGMDNVAEISYTAMIKTAGHELTHFIQNWSPSKYLTLKNTTLKFLKEAKGEDWINEQLKDIQRDNKAIGKKLTLEQAKDELVADAFEDVLSNIDFAETILRTDKTLFDKIHSWVKKHANDFKKNLGIALKDVEAQTEAGLTMKKASDRAQALYNEWADAFSTALENSTVQQSEVPTDADGYVQLQQLQARQSAVIKKYDSSKDRITKNINDLALMDSVYAVDKSKLNKTGKKPSDLFKEYFDSWKNSLDSEELGTIALRKSSVKSEIRHGVTAEKIASIEAIPTVIKKGKIIFVETKSGSDVQRIVVAAPIKIGSNSYYMGVMLQRDNQNQALYLHNIAIEKEASKLTQADLLTTGADANNERLFITSILQNALIVKYKKELSTNSTTPDTQNQARVTKEQDSAYMEAVKNGDTETAQRMVEEAAKKAGYAVKAYHGTDSDFNVYSYETIGQATGVGILGEGFYFTDKKGLAKVYGKNIKASYLSLENPYTATNDDLYKINTDKLANEGYDCVVFDAPKGRIINIFDNTKVKSADPVTYDDNGNVIPLSERFNPENEDIRYSARNISRTKDIRLKKAKATIARDFVGSMPESSQKAKLKVLANNYAKQIKAYEKEQRIYIEATANGNEEIATVAYAGMTLAEVAIDQIETDVDFASMINENATREKLREAYTREGELEEEIRAFESDLTAAEREVRESKRLAEQFAEREKQAKYRAKQIELRNQRDRNTSLLLKEKTRLKSALDKPSENASVPKDAKRLAEQVINLVDALNAFNGTAALTRPSAELIDRIMKMSDDAEKLANGSKSKSLAQRVNSVDIMMRNARLSVEQVKSALSELEKQYRKLAPDYERADGEKRPSAAASIIYDKSLHEGLRVLAEYFGESNIVLESGMYFAKEGLKIVRAMNHQILKANETYIKGKNVDVLKLRDRLYKDALVTSPFLNRVLGSKFVSNILMPKTMIHIALGATENADTLYDMFDEGQMRYIRFMNGARELFMPIEKELSGEKFKTNKADLKTGLKYTDGTEVLLNYDMAMSLIKIVDDADNLRHAVWGGLHIPDLKPYNQGDKAVAYNSKRIVEHAQPESAPEAMSDEEIATKLQDAASKGTELTNEDYLDMYAQQIAWSNRLNLATEIEAKYKAAAQMLKEQMSKTEVGKQALKALSIISDYYDNYARKHLDEATTEMYGFEKTLQEGKHYYPIRIRKDEKYKNDNEFIVRDYSLENWGNMKHRVNSKKGIELFGAVTELESYMESTAKYYGWTNVIKNMHKILDTQIIDDKGNNTTLIGAVNKLHGSYEKGKFFKNLSHSGFERYMQDLENAIVGVNKSDDKWLSIFHGAFVTNALVLNFSTPLVQYSALPLVAADSGLGSFLKSTAKKPPILSEARLKYIAKYSEVYRYRASGLINADVAAARQNRSKMVRVLSSKALAWTETADAQVLGHQFYALLENVKRTHKGISEERAAQIAGKQLDQTIYDFQANYTVLQRAPVLQGSGLKKMIFGTFRTQQITMFNAYLDSAVRSNTLKAKLKTLKEGTVEYNQTKAKYNESRLRTTKINLAILASNVLNSFIRMGVVFLRHKDDEDERWQNFAWDLLDSYTSMFTVVGEVIGWVVKYYHGENYYNDDAISFGAFDIFNDALESFADLTDGEEASAKENVKDLMNVLALFGVPARNAYNLLKALLGWVEKLFDETGVDFDFNLDEW